MKATEKKSKGGAESTSTVYHYTWGNNSKRKTMKGRCCRVLARMKMNSVVIRFEDNGQIEVTSRYALRRVREH